VCSSSAAYVILAAVYDLPPGGCATDAVVVSIREYTDRLAHAAAPGAHIVEIFPFLRYLPAFIAKWKRDAQAFFRKDSEMFLSLYQGCINDQDTQRHHECIAKKLAGSSENLRMTEEEIAWLCGTLFSAGAETTSGALAWFMLAMILHPEVQRKAQQELDTHVVRSRLPSFEDKQHLPYIVSIVKEILRWRPILPLGLPHALIQDDQWENNHIPRGTICIQNIWAINRDPEIYGKDADQFRPDRYLNVELGGSPLDNYDEEGHSTYGAGRRICQGRHFANETLFIHYATILWGLDISPKLDTHGFKAVPDEYSHISTGMTLHPLPFDCNITPRFPGVASLLSDHIYPPSSI